MRALAATLDHVRMEWLRKSITWVALLGVPVGIGAVVWVVTAHRTLSNGELADALGDQDEFFSSVSVTCVGQSGRLPGAGFYDRKCSRVDYDGFCMSGTGESRSTLFVRVHGQEYHVVRQRYFGKHRPCAPVA